MTPNIVVDVGNTRLKWGLCEDARVSRVASLGDSEVEWLAQLAAWNLREPLLWVLASVQPARSDKLAAWLESRHHRVVRLRRAAELPLNVSLAAPDKAGIDRLLNAVAAARELAKGQPGVLVDAGSAVTLDWLDEQHRFQGGAIYPGLDLMAEALHEHTALLPRVQVNNPVPSLPAGDTIKAMQVGIFLAVSGGIREAVRLYARGRTVSPRVFMTGGQAPLLATAMGLVEESQQADSPWKDWRLWPEMTLEGIRRSVEDLP